MRTGVGRILTVGALALALLFAGGCWSKSVGRSNLGTRIGGRTVKASLDGAGFLGPLGDSVVITFAAGEVVIEKGAVRMGEEEVAKLREETKEVFVDFTAGMLTVTADGKPVFSADLRK
jgi:hypothetical protein